jgi:hypothetical protein
MRCAVTVVPDDGETEVCNTKHNSAGIEQVHAVASAMTHAGILRGSWDPDTEPPQWVERGLPDPCAVRVPSRGRAPH